MKPSDVKISILVASYDEKTSENYRNCYVAEKQIDSKQLNITILYFNRSELDLSDETIRIQNFHFSKKLRWKNCWKIPKCLRCREAHSFQINKGIDPKFWYHKLMTWIEIVSKFYAIIFYTFREIIFQRAFRSHRVGSSF